MCIKRDSYKDKGHSLEDWNSIKRPIIINGNRK